MLVEVSELIKVLINDIIFNLPLSVSDGVERAIVLNVLLNNLYFLISQSLLVSLVVFLINIEFPLFVNEWPLEIRHDLDI
jgi:hypothetical protein